MGLQKTYFIKETAKKWLLINATNITLGRLASQITKVLRGKHKCNYTPFIDCGDNVVIINAKKIKLTGKKLLDKIYYKHTGYPGGLKEKAPSEIINGAFPERLLKIAVKGMMPKNSSLAKRQLKNLYVYPCQNHNHIGQKPKITK